MRETNVDLICRLLERGVRASLRDTKAILLAKLADHQQNSSAPRTSSTQTKQKRSPKEPKKKPVNPKLPKAKKPANPQSPRSPTSSISPKPTSPKRNSPTSPKSHTSPTTPKRNSPTSPKSPKSVSPKRSPSLSPLLYARTPSVRLIATLLEPLNPLVLFDMKRLNEFFYFMNATSIEDYIARCANYLATLTPIIEFEKRFAWKQITQSIPEWRNINGDTRKNYEFLFLEHLHTAEWSIHVAVIPITIIVKQLHTTLADFIPLVARVLHAFRYTLDDEQLLILFDYLSSDVLAHKKEYTELPHAELRQLKQDFLYTLGPEQHENTLFLLSQLDLLFATGMSEIVMRDYFPTGLRTIADYIVSLPEYNFNSEQVWDHLENHLTENSTYWREEITPQQRLKYKRQFFKWIDEPHLTRERLIEMVGLRVKSELLNVEAPTRQEYENVVAFIIAILESYVIDYTAYELKQLFLIIVDALDFMSEYWNTLDRSEKQHLQTKIKRLIAE